MKDAKPQVIAQKLLNLYRQYHVINGKWATLNPIFMAEGTADVISELGRLPTGDLLARHIKNLREGRGGRDSIDPELLPFDGAMETQSNGEKFSSGEISELNRELRIWKPDQINMQQIKDLAIVKKSGDGWREQIAAALAGNPELSSVWANVIKYDTATGLWFRASQALGGVPTERLRAEVQADMLGYENYLPMFGGAGQEMLTKLKQLMGSGE
ncbi:MAG: hypothetical protein LBB23_00760 [Rickettsiales bacterium]|jgi:hypothetical protein|nr:hypothetical protein [Rickettsiales bacterium]